MKQIPKKRQVLSVVFSIILVSLSINQVYADSIPEWVKNNALWYGQGLISETEFLNAMTFLIENGVIIIENTEDKIAKNTDAVITIPNGNSDIASSGFYLPLNLEIPINTKVIWTNEDSVPHNIQSQDEFGKVTDLFNSPPLKTGDKFDFVFDESGVFSYHCSFHPWRVGLVTVK